ncbi:hypothetical protein GCM10025868_19450 [Angustibacter aerolatus]|uniref:Uncharacterized protein n=1 Tax=Angustibacter aerolatus TaxID=1162965 RepID=A0ABQ6JIP8_9ACTN|nr:hypothetical protein [Angustibacter aerolatus]GMA86695.1 hypothetical protein GCM10025868_19450 [Angustibacter aerolatus]
MRLSTRSVLAGASTLAIAAGLLTAGAMSASADVSTPAYNDADAYGTLTLYDASGAVKTSGSINDAPFAAYLVGSSAQQGDNPNKRAALFGCAVDPAVPTPALWNCTGLSGSKVYPNVSAPEPIRSSANPTATVVPTDPSLSDLVAQYPPLAGGLYQAAAQGPGADHHLADRHHQDHRQHLDAGLPGARRRQHHQHQRRQDQPAGGRHVVGPEGDGQPL